MSVTVLKRSNRQLLDSVCGTNELDWSCWTVCDLKSIIRSNPDPPCRQNAELARLRQDCVRLGRELAERGDALRGDEERRKSLEAKMAATEQELAKAQVRNAELLS